MSRRGLRALTVLRRAEWPRWRSGAGSARWRPVGCGPASTRPGAEMAEGRYNVAWNRLSGLAAGGAGGEVDYQLGLCELYRGHRAAAMVAWERVPPGTPFAAHAAVQSAMLTMDSGRFTRARELLRNALRRLPDPEKKEPLLALQLLYQLKGGPRMSGGRSSNAWTSADSPAAVLVQLYRLDTAPFPLEMTRNVLDKADSNDDRVWLARANLAIRTGRFDVAGRWLDACLQRRPDDRATWRSRLELAVASGDADAAWQALEHLPADEYSPAESLRLRAWLARQQGDDRAERTALMALIDQEPGDTAGLDRLAELALTAGDAAEGDRLRSRQAEMTAAKERYRLLLRGETPGDPAELARLAETLGRRHRGPRMGPDPRPQGTRTGQGRPAARPSGLDA